MGLVLDSLTKFYDRKMREVIDRIVTDEIFRGDSVYRELPRYECSEGAPWGEK
jgi:hypothetical protein